MRGPLHRHAPPMAFISPAGSPALRRPFASVGATAHKQLTVTGRRGDLVLTARRLVAICALALPVFLTSGACTSTSLAPATDLPPRAGGLASCTARSQCSQCTSDSCVWCDEGARGRSFCSGEPSDCTAPALIAFDYNDCASLTPPSKSVPGSSGTVPSDGGTGDCKYAAAAKATVRSGSGCGPGGDGSCCEPYEATCRFNGPSSASCSTPKGTCCGFDNTCPEGTYCSAATPGMGTCAASAVCAVCAAKSAPACFTATCTTNASCSTYCGGFMPAIECGPQGTCCSRNSGVCVKAADCCTGTCQKGICT